MGGGTNLGLFSGVYMPVCESMWGVILFLKVGKIVGKSGVVASVLGIILLSYTAVLLTTLSLSAIVSNERGPVGRGGAYRLILRALGPELGGAVGVMYYLGLMFLACLEVLGTVEVLIETFKDELGWPGAIQLFSVITFVAITLMVYGGTKLVARLGVVFLSFVALSMVLMMAGLLASDEGGSDVLSDNAMPSESGMTVYTSMLALFFPSFTGILSGANRAEVLADPKRSIPWGTLGAVTTSMVLYSTMMILWGSALPSDKLISEPFIIREIMWPVGWIAPPLIMISSMAQSLQIMIVAPKVLQAIAADRVIPFLAPFDKLSETGQPVRALFATAAMATTVSMVGDLELVAPLLSLCFLLCYTALNLSCFVLEVLHAPGWRPRWRIFHWATAVVGAGLCTMLMFLMAWYWAVVVFAVWFSLYMYINWKGVESSWGDGLRGLLYQLALRSLLSQGLGDHYSRNWRPQILALVEVTPAQLDAIQQNAKVLSSKTGGGGGGGGGSGGDAEDGTMANRGAVFHALTPESGDMGFHQALELEEAFTRSLDGVLSVAAQLRKGNGLCIVTALMEGLFAEANASSNFLSKYLRGQMAEHGLRGFPQVVVGPAFMQSRDYVVQTAGLGGLSPNTVLMEYPEGWREQERISSAVQFVDSLISVSTSEKAAIILRNPSRDFPSTAAGSASALETGTIDVWWILHDGGLLILLSYLLRKHEVWAGCSLRIFTVVEEGDDSEAIHADLVEKVDALHIDATVSVVVLPNDAIHPYSVDWQSRAAVHDNFMRTLNVKDEALPSEVLSIAHEAHSGLRSIPSTVDLEQLRLPKVARDYNALLAANEPDVFAWKIENDGGADVDSDDYHYSYGYGSYTEEQELASDDSGFLSYDSSLLSSSEPVELTQVQPTASATTTATATTSSTGTSESRTQQRQRQREAEVDLGLRVQVGPPPPGTGRKVSGRIDPKDRLSPPKKNVTRAKRRSRNSQLGQPTPKPDTASTSSILMRHRKKANAATSKLGASGSSGSRKGSRKDKGKGEMDDRAGPINAAMGWIGASKLSDTARRRMQRSDSMISTTSTKGDTVQSIGLLKRQLTSMVSMANLHDVMKLESLESLRKKHPDWDKLNRVILGQSRSASLVLINLPDVYLCDELMTQQHMESVIEWMSYVEVLSSNMPRVLFVHGTGKELVGSF